ncbi:YggS family pyridoxal phosphate-dependent enzyme [Candidatus Pelagibacter sp.]|uniref:YggS family pyridoxal phosphate-dependent enzyme n=1 Tax=Candidatus Pelagibacter sp. TaxID=2024849 RepID=UPI003F850333|tara:strand:+ start:7330 stop:7989 length:660 start_codon:yes stop_codon:yes gene_type:complete
MHKTIQNLIDIQKKIDSSLKSLTINKVPKIIAVSKTFGMDKISPLIDHGHLDFGENKVQEAIEKWSDVKSNNANIKLHLIGGLQTNKVKSAVRLFDFIHSVDSEKLAQKISNEQQKQKKELKLFIQVNIGDEQQKSGVDKASVSNLYSYCKSLNLNVVGLMCIPPFEKPSEKFFKEMNMLNKDLNLNELSMGMSSDYLNAIKNSATYVRIGSNIFGQRS